MKIFVLRNSNVWPLSAMVFVTAVWGSTFIVVKNAVLQMPVMDFLGMRFLLAGLVMFALRPNCLKGITTVGYVRAIILGLILGSAFIAQTFGLQHTSATLSGFITGMFVVLTPLIAWLVLKHKIGLRLWFAVLMAITGLGFLSIHDWSIGIGELLTLMCAFLFAAHIVTLGQWSSKHNVYGLAFLQILTVGIVSMLAATPGGITLPPNAGVWGAVVLTAVLASALAYIIQTWVQRLISPSSVAVTMTMEPVFAGLFGVTIADEELSLRIIIGGILILVAMIVTGLQERPKESVK